MQQLQQQAERNKKSGRKMKAVAGMGTCAGQHWPLVSKESLPASSK